MRNILLLTISLTAPSSGLLGMHKKFFLHSKFKHGFHACLQLFKNDITNKKFNDTIVEHKKEFRTSTFSTANDTPDWAKYKLSGYSDCGNYPFQKLTHTYAFVQQEDEYSASHIYISSHVPIHKHAQHLSKQNITAKSTVHEAITPEQALLKLSYNLQSALIRDMKMWGNWTAKDSFRAGDVATMLRTMPQELRDHWIRIIFDFANNKPNH